MQFTKVWKLILNLGYVNMDYHSQCIKRCGRTHFHNNVISVLGWFYYSRGAHLAFYC